MEGAVIFDVKEEGERERERRGALSFDAHNPSLFVVFDPFCRFAVCVLSFSFPSCRLALFLLFVVFSNWSFFYSIVLLFFFVVSYFSFVVFLLSLIRERHGALLFALNEESAAKVTAAYSSHLTVFVLKY